jgi:NAD(P)-dependent dehydrogenase (short-subunit alcohol dehydrogenase family)
MSPYPPTKCLLFGGTGSIGTAIGRRLKEAGMEVWVVSRGGTHATSQSVTWDPLSASSAVPQSLLQPRQFDAVCWAQGMNLNDSIRDFDSAGHREMYEANVLFVMTSLRELLSSKCLARGSRLCIVSSIWQNISRSNKLSYSVTKSALRGLVLSLVSDLGAEGFLVNAVLPGAVDTPMTRANLTSEQLAAVEDATSYGRLASLDDVANTVSFLCSSANTAVTGQFVAVDFGFSNVRVV